MWSLRILDYHTELNFLQCLLLVYCPHFLDCWRFSVKAAEWEAFFFNVDWIWVQRHKGGFVPGHVCIYMTTTTHKVCDEKHPFLHIKALQGVYTSRPIWLICSCLFVYDIPPQKCRAAFEIWARLWSKKPLSTMTQSWRNRRIDLQKDRK